MERSTVCMVCGGLAEHPHSCRMCGKVVCTKCFNSELGMCTYCASRVKG